MVVYTYISLKKIAQVCFTFAAHILHICFPFIHTVTQIQIQPKIDESP